MMASAESGEVLLTAGISKVLRGARQGQHSIRINDQ